MAKISRDELRSKLLEVKRAMAVSVVTVTVPPMNKKLNGEANPFYGRVQKRAYTSCVINFRYENSVNYQRAREGKDLDFAAMPRKWGVHVDGTPLIEHHGKYYLEYKVERVIESYYLLDGELADDEVVEPYLVKRNKASRQDVNKEVVLNDVHLENIEAIVMGGETYEIIKEEVMQEAL